MKYGPKHLSVLTGLLAGAIVVSMAGAAFSMAGCASAPPNYSEAGRKAFNADQLLKDINALGSTARNLNATTGKLHLSDFDTALVRDFSLSAGAGLMAYANGSGTLAIVVTAYHEMAARLSMEARLNPTLKYALSLIDGAISNLPK